MSNQRSYLKIKAPNDQLGVKLNRLLDTLGVPYSIEGYECRYPSTVYRISWVEAFDDFELDTNLVCHITPELLEQYIDKINQLLRLPVVKMALKTIF